MDFILQPWQLYLAILAGWINREQQEVIEYLRTENQILKEKLGKKRILLSDDQRRRLAVKGKILGRKRLEEVGTLFTPDTILRWHRMLVAKKWDYSDKQKPGRPRIRQVIVDLILRFARENPSWGYDRIQGALANVGYHICDQTVGNVLKEHGIEPAPDRKRQTTWKTFLKAHWNTLAAIDFTTVEVWTKGGLVTFYLLFVMELKTRRVHFAGCATNPHTAWMKQTAVLFVATFGTFPREFSRLRNASTTGRVAADKCNTGVFGGCPRLQADGVSSSSFSQVHHRRCEFSAVSTTSSSPIGPISTIVISVVMVALAIWFADSIRDTSSLAHPSAHGLQAMWKHLIAAIAFAIPFIAVTNAVRGQETRSYAAPLREIPEVWPSFTIPAVREDWFDFKAEVDADKGLLTRIAPYTRRELADGGINVFGWYMMAFQGNPVGGVNRDFEASGLNDFGLDFDLEKLCCLEDLSMRISGSWAWGPNLTDDVGATIPVNAVFSGTAWRFFEMYFEQWVLDDTVSLRVGRLTTGWEYGLDYDFFTQYLSAAYRLNVGGLGLNSPNFSLIPYANWGVRLKWQPNDNWQFKASFMNGHPKDFADPKYAGLQLDFQPGKGTLWIGEVTYRWQATDAQRTASGRLPGQFKFGGYADTSQTDYVDGSPRKETGLGSLYAILRQKVWEPEPVSHRGIHLWTAFSYAWEEEIVTFPYYWNGGAVWQGPFDTRSEDTLALGFARGWYSDSLVGQSTETVLECAYNWYINDVLTLTPNAQYVLTPGGTGDIDDALILGLLTYITY